MTKQQRQGAVGAELLVLCQTITEDGSLSDDELSGLKRWLDDHRGADLPSIGFLVHTVEQILADGKVTKEERQDLYRTIEAVLPTDVRREATAKRREIEAEERARMRAQRDVDKARSREEQERNRPVGDWDFMVAGVHHEGRGEVVRRHLRAGDRVFLVRDRANRHSRHAVEVRLQNGMQVGFVPEDIAVEAAPLLDKGHPHEASCKKILTGGRAPIPVVIAAAYRPDATVEGLVGESDVLARASSGVPAGTRRTGCAVLIVTLVTFSVLLMVVAVVVGRLA